MLGRIIRAKVFFEGIEVPFYRITVQNAIGAPSIALIDIPPSEKFFERVDEEPLNSSKFVKKTGVLARTLVHVFYEDSADPDGVSRLLFEGEFVQFEYIKDKNRRAIRIVARDISNLLSYIYVRNYSDFFTPYGKFISAFTGINKNQEVLRLEILRLANINPEISEAMQADFREVGIGSAFRSILLKALELNAFFKDFQNRTKINRKVVTFADAESRQLLAISLFESMIKQNISNLKESSTVWDLYATLMGLVFYHPVTIPCAPFIRSAVTDTTIDIDGKERSFQAIRENTIVSLLLKPYSWWTAPANFNVIFPNQYKTFTFGRDLLSEPTRLLVSSFGILESFAQADLQKVTPSTFMYIAPTALAKKWDQDAFNTKIRDAGQRISVDLEKEISNLTAQKAGLQGQKARPGVLKSDADRLTRQIADLDTQITTQRTALDQIRTDAEADKQRTTIEQSTGKRRAQIAADVWNQNILTAADGVSLASREDIKGIIFGFDYLTQTQVEVTKSKAVSSVDLQQYLSNVANYKLAIQQHMKRRASLTCHFLPNLVTGFPALVVDPNRNFFGEVDAVVHTLDAEGLADTQVQLSFVRGDETEFTEEFRNTPGNVIFPEWINQKYLPDNIGTEIYAKLFPANGLIPAAKSILAFDIRNQVAAARELRKRYFVAGDKAQFSFSFTVRNIASIDQTFEIALGAQKLNENRYFVGTSDSERALAVQEYVQSVSEASRSRADVPAEITP